MPPKTLLITFFFGQITECPQRKQRSNSISEDRKGGSEEKMIRKDGSKDEMKRKSGSKEEVNRKGGSKEE